MTALTFALREPPPQRVDCSPLSVDALAGKSRTEIERIGLWSGNRQLPVAELFTVSGADAARIVFANACEKLDRIGADMSAGQVIVEGAAGAYLGLRMRGGEIEARADAGALAACQMRGGRIRIAGNAGDFLGAALPGETRGMTGGSVIVAGNVGDRCADRMRRGQILVEGKAGDYCAARMLAGSVVVMGSVGAGLGYAMQRGTVLLRSMPESISPTFGDCGEHALSFLKLLFDSWARLPTRLAQFAPPRRVRRFVGDLANQGKGELLISCG